MRRILFAAVFAALLAPVFAQPLPSLCPARCLRIHWIEVPELDVSYVIRWGTVSGVYTGSKDVGRGIWGTEGRYADIGSLKVGIDYYVVVQAYDVVTGLHGPYSEEATTSDQPPTTRPVAPKQLRIAEVN